MKLNVLVLGAGFGGLELSSILSERIGEHLDLTLIDKNDSFYFGFSKLDVMFGRKPVNAVKLPYSHIKKHGVKFRQEIIEDIDPIGKRVTTQNGTYKPDVLVVALGAEYNVNATPGLLEGGNEFYSFEGAERLREIIPNFKKGNAIVGVTSTPFKCPPAPSEAALLLDDYLTKQGVRDDCKISLVMPFGLPVPPSPGTSKALLKAFAERDISFIPQSLVRAIEPTRKVAILDDGSQLPFDLFLGIPVHIAPEVVARSGMAVNGWIPVDKRNLKAKFPGIYAIGDVTSVGTPKAGAFAEGAARIVAESIIAEFNGNEYTSAYAGDGTCYVEFGQDKVGRVDVDFFSGTTPTGINYEASEAYVSEKEHFGSDRKARWFGL
jgi:sulfide:quinone oxidoreductase